LITGRPAKNLYWSLPGPILNSKSSGDLLMDGLLTWV